MQRNERVKFANKYWDVIPLACGYLWRITCGTENRTINHEMLIQLKHGK